jgi:hypothetical protein
MQRKKYIVIAGVLVLVVGAAAFTAGRLLHRGASPLGLLGFGGKRGVMEISINLIPAKELPESEPEIIGLFAQRKDKTIVVQSTSLRTGGPGVVVHKGEDGAVLPSSNMNYGPSVEVVITNETMIYRDTTEIAKPTSSGTQTIQQTVEDAWLVDLNAPSEITVWGRKSGDRITAEVLLSNPITFEGYSLARIFLCGYL